MKLKLEFGALAPPLAKQVKAQGLRFNLVWMRACQREAEAIVLLAATGILTEAEAERARRRLMQGILHEMEKRNRGGS